MSAPWHCWRCGRGDGSDGAGRRVCDCEMVRREDWLALRLLWMQVRRVAQLGSLDGVFYIAIDGTLVVDREHAERLDALFFAGEEISAMLPSHVVDCGPDGVTPRLADSGPGGHWHRCDS